jgi:molecular chaperone GrpE
MAEDQSSDQDVYTGKPKDDSRETEASDDTAAGELEALRKELEEARGVVAGCKDQLLRKAAEFENYRRRTDADFASIIKNANENLILNLVPVLDDFERSLKAGKDSADYDGLYKGVALIHGKFSKILESQGLTPFSAVGTPFDVDLHDALLQIPRNDLSPQTVIEEVERGYMLNNKVLRHAKVIVSTTAPPEDADAKA